VEQRLKAYTMSHVGHYYPKDITSLLIKS